MAAIINTNVSSLNAQRNLTTSQSSLATSIQRLSSGLRINSAKDDAAGLAISERMTSQIRGLNQAARNANDGISLAQTAEGALGAVGTALQRIRELAVQSSNATNSASDRQALQSEVNQLVSEIDRVSQQTEFNGIKLLDGSFTSQAFQVGANAGQTISIAGISSAKASSLGGLAAQTGTAVSAAASTDLTIALGGGAAVSVSPSSAYVGSNASQDATSAYAKAAAINAAGISGLTVTASTAGTQAVGAIGGTAGDTYNLTINGVAVFTNTDVAAGLSNTQLRDAINNVSQQTGVTATLSGGNMTLTAADGRNITVTESGTGFTAGTDGLSVTGGPFAAVLRGNLSISATDSITIGGTVATVGLSASIAKDTVGIDSVDLTTFSGAQAALQRVDSALKTVNSARAALGAYQNRFEQVVSNVQTTAENVTAARSRIQDTDFAAETANLSRAQILQQAGTAMVAQANQLPQTVLSLLK